PPPGEAPAADRCRRRAAGPRRRHLPRAPLRRTYQRGVPAVFARHGLPGRGRRASWVLSQPVHLSRLHHLGPENGTGTFIIPLFRSLLRTNRFARRVPHPPSGLDSASPPLFCQGPRPLLSFFPRPRLGTEPPGTPAPVSPRPRIRSVEEV